jgi:hypothetical protein
VQGNGGPSYHAERPAKVVGNERQRLIGRQRQRGAGLRLHLGFRPVAPPSYFVQANCLRSKGVWGVVDFFG